MSRTGQASWRVDVLRRGTGPVPVRVSVRGREVEILPEGSRRPLVFDVRKLAELVLDLQEAGRMLRSVDAATFIAQMGRERYGPPEQWAPILTPEEIEQLDGDE
ncbi:hypothetical protein WEH80_37980 [Actinomycetes bacterium KLBMP 9759]